MSDVGQKIKKRREDLGMTQQQLADKVGYKSRVSINKIESGRDIPMWKLCDIARALKVEPDYLLGWDQLDEENSIQANYDIYIEQISEIGLDERRKKVLLTYAKLLSTLSDDMLPKL